MPISPSRTLRLNIAQWQGSDRPDYLIGGRVLAALAPAASGPEITIDVPSSAVGVRPVADGIASKAELLAIAERAMAAIRQHEPQAIVTLGGDCLVDLAPMAYLNEQYGDDLAILWVDAHPDIMGAAQMRNAHAHVLGMLMGEGDPDFGRLVKHPIRPQQVLYVGLTETTPYETEFLNQRQMQRLSPEQIAQSPDAVATWLRQTGATKVAVHFDLDVLDAARYSFLLFNDPAAAAGTWDGVAQGRMRLEDIARILQQANEVAEVVGLAIAEYLPWDAIQLAKALRTLPLLNR